MNVQAPSDTSIPQEENRLPRAASDAQATETILSGHGGLLVVVLLSILTWAPLLYPGFIQTHSGLGAVYDALSARPLLTGWLPTYGTPGDGPLASWLLALLAPALGPLAGLKLLYALSFVLAGSGMFWLARGLSGGAGAIVAATVYMLIPYRLSAVYVRGGVAEALLLGAAPFLFVVVQEAVPAPRGRKLVAVALLTLVLALTNLGLGLLVAIVAVAYGAVVQTSAVSETSGVWTTSAHRRPILACVIAALVGIAAAWMMLWPAGGRVLANMPGWSDHFVYFFQLFAPGWGFGESTAGWQDATSFQLGLAPVALAILALWAVLEPGSRAPRGDAPATIAVGWESSAGILPAGAEHAPDTIPDRAGWALRAAQERRSVFQLLAFAGVLVLLSLTLAAPLWRVLPLATLVAYPWQMLGPAGIFLALLAGATVNALSPASRPSLTMVGVVLAAAVLGSYSYLAPRFIDQADLPDLGHRPLAQLGDGILLLDAQHAGEAHPGDTLRLRLTWQAIGQPAADFTIFAQLFDARGVKRGQQDVRPHNGDRPTSVWLRGEIVTDDIGVPLAADAPPGEYSLQVGMYLLATMQRLPVAGTGGNEFTLGPINVR